MNYALDSALEWERWPSVVDAAFVAVQNVVERCVAAVVDGESKSGDGLESDCTGCVRGLS